MRERERDREREKESNVCELAVMDDGDAVVATGYYLLKTDRCSYTVLSESGPEREKEREIEC